MTKLFYQKKCPIERLHIDKKRYLICSLLLRQLIKSGSGDIREKHKFQNQLDKTIPNLVIIIKCSTYTKLESGGDALQDS